MLFKTLFVSLFASLVFASCGTPGFCNCAPNQNVCPCGYIGQNPCPPPVGPCGTTGAPACPPLATCQDPSIPYETCVALFCPVCPIPAVCSNHEIPLDTCLAYQCAQCPPPVRKLAKRLDYSPSQICTVCLEAPNGYTCKTVSGNCLKFCKLGKIMKDCFIGYGAMNKNGVAECKDGAEPFEKAGTDGICLPKCNQGQVPLSISNVKNGNVVDSTVVVGDRCQ